ncbi:immunity protein YezG family protein [Vibrio atypicus]|uniref:immunity protein YezG family protein n=1 Tax=Vibrio atypicus TaxID=558271 RepID=UPI003734EFC0
MLIDETYRSIAQNIIDSIDSSWDKAVLNIEVVAGDTIGFNGEYIIDGEHVSFKFRNFDRRKLSRDGKSLHKVTTKNDSNIWNKAKFTLYPTGKFNIEFEWDQALEDEVNANS